MVKQNHSVRLGHCNSMLTKVVLGVAVAVVVSAQQQYDYGQTPSPSFSTRGSGGVGFGGFDGFGGGRFGASTGLGLGGLTSVSQFGSNLDGGFGGVSQRGSFGEGLVGASGLRPGGTRGSAAGGYGSSALRGFGGATTGFTRASTASGFGGQTAVGFGRGASGSFGLTGPVSPILKDDRQGPDAYGNYNFIYETADGVRRQEQGVSQSETGAVSVQGGWSFTYPDGTPADFKFIADEGGYRVESPLLPPLPAHAIAQIEKARQEDAAAAVAGVRGSYVDNSRASGTGFGSSSGGRFAGSSGASLGTRGTATAAYDGSSVRGLTDSVGSNFGSSTGFVGATGRNFGESSASFGGLRQGSFGSSTGFRSATGGVGSSVLASIPGSSVGFRREGLRASSLGGFGNPGAVSALNPVITPGRTYSAP